MGAWSGFQTDLLKAAGIGTSTGQQQFMFDWNFAASSDCADNPVDISRNVRGSTSCKRLTPSRVARNYSSQAQAEAAFAGQIKSGNYPHLLAALKTDNPYAYSDPAGVEADLKAWGSPDQAAYYAKNATGGGTTSSSGRAPRAHSGWASMQHSLNDHWRPTLNRSARNVDAALRSLGHGRKVRL